MNLQHPKRANKIARLLERASALDQDSLSRLVNFADLQAIRRSNANHDVTSSFSRDVLCRVGQFLEPADLRSYAASSPVLRDATSKIWIDRGERVFNGILVGGQTFSEALRCSASPEVVYQRFRDSWGFMPNKFCTNPRPDTLRVRVQEDLHNFTVPLAFSISTSASIFLDIAAEMRFGPDMVRSVIGFLEDIGDLECDRGLSTDSWGMAFGPLSGIISSNGLFFDRLHTYVTGPYMRDFLQAVAVDTIGVRVGMFFDQGKVSFFRHTEEGSDWECTGVVYECKKGTKHLIPSVMFARVSPAEDIKFQLRGIYDKAPFAPHINREALDSDAWLPFEESAYELMINPELPNEDLDDLEDFEELQHPFGNIPNENPHAARNRNEAILFALEENHPIVGLVRPEDLARGNPDNLQRAARHLADLVRGAMHADRVHRE